MSIVIEVIDNYENKCKQNFLVSNKSNSIKESISKLIEDTNNFLNVNQKEKINNINTFNQESLKLQSKINQEIKKFQNLIFNNSKIEFVNSSDDSILGFIYYNKCFTVSFFFKAYFYCLTLKYFFKNLLSSSFDGFIKLWDLEESTECILTYEAEASHIKSLNLPVVCFKCVTEKNWLISGHYEGIIKILNLETGECIRKFQAHSQTVQSILVILSNNQFVTCSRDKTIKLFDMTSFECIKTFTGHSGLNGVNSIDKISNEKIISCSDDETLRIWDLISGECNRIIKTKNLVSCIKVFSDQIVISGSIGYIQIWNIQTGVCLKTLNENYCLQRDFNFFENLQTKESLVECIEILSNVSGDREGFIRIWNINDGKCLKKIKAHLKRILCLTKISINKIVSCSEDKEIKIWDTNNFHSDNCLKTIIGHDKGVTCIDLF